MVLHQYCQTTASNLAFGFILGAYVNTVFSRWIHIFDSIPWTMRTAVLLAAHVKGNDDVARAMKRTIIRYMMLCYVMAMRSLSPPVQKRFPTMTHLTIAGYLNYY